MYHYVYQSAMVVNEEATEMDHYRYVPLHRPNISPSFGARLHARMAQW